jgi:ribosomal 30S subunit maturation factor RimM
VKVSTTGLIDVFDTGANDVIVVCPEKSKEAVAVESDVQDDAKADKKAKKNKHEDERLIPFVDDVIVDVDLAKKTMLVDWDETY